MAFSLAKRQSTLGVKLNPRTEYHGDDPVPACDFTLSKIMLDASELNALIDGENTVVDLSGANLYDAAPSPHDRLFYLGGPLSEPAFRHLKALVLDTKYERSSVSLWLGLNRDLVKLGGAKLAKIHLVPQTGGLTELSLQVQCNPEADQMALLYTHMSKDVEVTIRFGSPVKDTKEQPELPLDHAAQAEA